MFDFYHVAEDLDRNASSLAHDNIVNREESFAKNVSRNQEDKAKSLYRQSSLRNVSVTLSVVTAS